MSRARNIPNPKRYVILLEETTLIEFKRATYASDVKPQAVIRSLMEDYIDSRRLMSDGTHLRSRTDVVYGIMDQINLLMSGSGIFKLNDLVCTESLKFIKEIRACNAAYLHGTIPKRYRFTLANREHVSMRNAEGSYILHSSAHEVALVIKGFFVYIELPRSYITNTDQYARYCMINSLLITLSELALEYRGQLIEVLGRNQSAPQLSNKRYQK